MPIVLLAYYCALILVASIIGGMIPVWFQLTHRWMQFAISFVAGVMLGIGVLHMLPHAIMDAATAASLAAQTSSPSDSTLSTLDATATAVRWTTISLLAGMLTMFFIGRFFSFHHHDVPDDEELLAEAQELHDHEHTHEHSHPHAHDHSQGHAHGANLSWSGAALGLALHSMLNGVALAAAVQCDTTGSWIAGFSTFLVIVLHKPFDAMTISMLMGRGGWSLAWRHTINGLFSLAIPVGVLVFYFGLMPEQSTPDVAGRQWYIACALAFSAGTFLCISLSDLLPELQFHQHDRVKLSVALLLGLAVAHLAAQLEAAAHPAHQRKPAPKSIAASQEFPLHALPELPDRCVLVLASSPGATHAE
jgi:zinc and cadmium transporter